MGEGLQQLGAMKASAERSGTGPDRSWWSVGMRVAEPKPGSRSSLGSRIASSGVAPTDWDTSILAWILAPRESIRVRRQLERPDLPRHHAANTGCAGLCVSNGSTPVPCRTGRSSTGSDAPRDPIGKVAETGAFYRRDVGHNIRPMTDDAVEDLQVPYGLLELPVRFNTDTRHFPQSLISGR